MFLNGQQIHSERETKKIEPKQKHRSDSTWFLHHLDPILRNNFSCRSESTEKPILAVTEMLHRLSRKSIIHNRVPIMDKTGVFIMHNRLKRAPNCPPFFPFSPLFLHIPSRIMYNLTQIIHNPEIVRIMYNLFFFLHFT